MGLCARNVRCDWCLVDWVYCVWVWSWLLCRACVMIAVEEHTKRGWIFHWARVFRRVCCCCDLIMCWCEILFHHSSLETDQGAQACISILERGSSWSVEILISYLNYKKEFLCKSFVLCLCVAGPLAWFGKLFGQKRTNKSTTWALKEKRREETQHRIRSRRKKHRVCKPKAPSSIKTFCWCRVRHGAWGIGMCSEGRRFCSCHKAKGISTGARRREKQTARKRGRAIA